MSMFHQQITLTIKSITDPKDWIDDVIQSQLDLNRGEYATLDKLTEIHEDYDDDLTPDDEAVILSYFTHNDAC